MQMFQGANVPEYNVTEGRCPKAQIFKSVQYYNYSNGRIKMPSYEAIYVIPPMFEGLNLRSSSMDFQVMGLI